MILYPEETLIDFSKMEHIPECKHSFPVVCYKYDLFSKNEPWHWHDEFEATVIINGEAVLKIENREYILKSGEAYFINSEILHSLSNADGKHCVIKTLIFRKDIVGGNSDSVFWQKYVTPLVERRDFHGCILRKSSSWQKNAIVSLNRIFELFDEEPEDFEIETRALLSKILSITIKNLPSKSQIGEKADRNNIAKIKVMLLYIWQNYQKPITLSDIASASATGKNDCLLCFSETVGTSPIQYLKNYRLEKAAEYLCSTKLKVSEIAELCGFSDKSYFSKSFYQKYGKKPLEYRNNLKNN